MLCKVCLYVVLVVMFVSIMPGDVLADRKRLLKPSEKAKAESKPIYIPESRHMITGFLSMGKLIGKITEQVPEGKDQLLYGYGFGYEFYIKPSLGLRVDMQFHWLSAPEDYGKQIKNTEYTVSTIYRFQPKSEKTFYVRAGLGSTNIKDASWFVKKRTLIRVGLGYLLYSSGNINTRMELSFKRMLKGSESYDIDYIAFDVGFGLPL